MIFNFYLLKQLINFQIFFLFFFTNFISSIFIYVPSLIEKICNKSSYTIGQGIGRKFKSENTSPQSRSHCRNLETCLHRTEVIIEIQKHVSTKPMSLQKSRRMSPQTRGHCRNPEGCLHKVEVIAGIQKDVSKSLGHSRNKERCLHRVEVIARIQKDVSIQSRSLQNSITIPSQDRRQLGQLVDGSRFTRISSQDRSLCKKLGLRRWCA